jgi:hypothetical protein
VENEYIYDDIEGLEDMLLDVSIQRKQNKIEYHDNPKKQGSGSASPYFGSGSIFSLKCTMITLKSRVADPHPSFHLNADVDPPSLKCGSGSSSK